MFANRKSIQLPFVVVIAAIALVMWLLLRIVLWLQVGPSQMLGSQSASAFVRGEWFDLAGIKRARLFHASQKNAMAS